MREIDSVLEAYKNTILEGNTIGEARATAYLKDLIQTKICNAERLAIIGERERVANAVNNLLQKGKPQS